MTKGKTISGFSKLSKRGKIKWIVENFFKDPESVMRELVSYWHKDAKQQKILDGFSENTISNFPMPFGVAPNFLIDGKTYVVPMVIEESSVVAAASAAAKFWLNRGGFKTEIIGTQKIGQVHFKWFDKPEVLLEDFSAIKKKFFEATRHLTKNMEARGGGILDISLISLTDELPNLYQIKASFETCDSMGANFINSILEQFALTLESLYPKGQLEIIMSILSNYTPECIVRASVSCSVEGLGSFGKSMDCKTFARKFFDAVEIARMDPSRATTHNKGIYNGIDAVVIATGNDFRAIEACGHTYAARDGQYRSLSHCKIKDGQFTFWIEVPLALGTVGGLTNLHPIARRSLELLDKPSAKELMSIVAATGLAQNFAAIRSLITTGIQDGHMKMHLQNILNSFNATEKECELVKDYFEDKTVSYQGVSVYLTQIRK